MDVSCQACRSRSWATRSQSRSLTDAAERSDATSPRVPSKDDHSCASVMPGAGDSGVDGIPYSSAATSPIAFPARRSSGASNKRCSGDEWEAAKRPSLKSLSARTQAMSPVEMREAMRAIQEPCNPSPANDSTMRRNGSKSASRSRQAAEVRRLPVAPPWPRSPPRPARRVRSGILRPMETSSLPRNQSIARRVALAALRNRTSRASVVSSEAPSVSRETGIKPAQSVLRVPMTIHNGSAFGGERSTKSTST